MTLPEEYMTDELRARFDSIIDEMDNQNLPNHNRWIKIPIQFDNATTLRRAMEFIL